MAYRCHSQSQSHHSAHLISGRNSISNWKELEMNGCSDSFLILFTPPAFSLYAALLLLYCYCPLCWKRNVVTTTMLCVFSFSRLDSRRRVWEIGKSWQHSDSINSRRAELLIRLFFKKKGLVSSFLSSAADGFVQTTICLLLFETTFSYSSCASLSLFER